MRPHSSGSAPRPDTAQHARHPGRQATCTSRLGESAQTEGACEHGTLHLAGNEHAGSRQLPDKGGSRASMQHLAAGRGSHGGSLSDSHVIMSKRILRDLMADLAQGVADIAQLRQEATSAQAPPAPCNTQILEAHHDRLLAPQCSSQEAGIPQPHLQHDNARASNRGGHSRPGQQKPDRAQTWQPATCSKPQAQQPARGPQEYTYAQPTGHPMTLWRGALHSERPLGGRPQRNRPVLHAGDVGKQGAFLQTSRAGASETRESRKTLENDVHTCKENRADAAQQILPQSKGTEGQTSQQQQGDEQPTMQHLHKASTPLHGGADASTAHAAPLPGKEECTTPALSPSLCQHLKQRYLPVYSVFDDRGEITCDLGGQDDTTCSFGSHKATLNGPRSPRSARQHAHANDTHCKPLYACGAAGSPIQSIHLNADTASPEV